VPEVFVSVGSNIDRRRNILSALDSLTSEFGELLVSPIYESEAVGFQGENFYNLVVAFNTDLCLDDLVARLHDIEYAHGRSRSDRKFAPRTLDLDLLTYGARVDHQSPHDVPRHEITEYAFVLRPLSEIAGETVHPETGQTYAQMWQAFNDGGQRLWRVELPRD
jgi:2-amino-4-hydroxy-6-hydroxymethyldihydropteridine diphosphokinase